MPPMRILFITSSRIGDAVLSTGLLSYIAQSLPESRVTIACGPLAVSLFEGYPNLETIIPLKKQQWSMHWISLWTQVVSMHWDIVVDLRNSAVSRLIRARSRHVFGAHIDKALHKVEQNAAVMGLETVPAPALWPSDKQNQATSSLIGKVGNKKILAVGPAANWAGKTWPAERFTEVVEYITAAGSILPGAAVAIFAAPSEEETAYEVLNAVPEDRQIDMIAKTDPGSAAAALALCDFYIGNDSGLMHCAAAAGIPTIGLFGPSYPHLYRPWGPHADYVSTPETYDELIDYEGYSPETAPCLMESLSVQAVKDKIDVFWEKQKAA